MEAKLPGTETAAETTSSGSPVALLNRFFGLFKKGELPFWVVMGSVLVSSLAIATHLHAPPCSDPACEHQAAVYALIAFCCLSAGAIIGFLFGIPHAATAEAEGIRPSTNLEQVSDWLTKIIIGVGLVEISKIQARLAKLGDLVNTAVGGSVVAPQFVVVIFAVLGFLSAYIWTRLYYGGMQVQADVDARKYQELEQRQKATEQLAATNEQRIAATEVVADNLKDNTERLKVQNTQQEDMLKGIAKNSNVARAVTIAPPVAAPAAADPAVDPLLADWQTKLARFMAEPAEWNDDPNGRIFGPLPTAANGRKLQVSITLQSTTSKSLFLKAELLGGDGPPLQGKVIFLLHPTYSDKRAISVPVEYSQGPAGCATYSFYAEGVFTVVAMADDGHTVLGYDLKNLPDASADFLSK